MKKTLLLLLLIPTLVQAQLVEHAGMNRPSFTPSPVINTSGTPLNPFTTSQGVPSADQPFTFTASNLTGNVTWTAGAGMEVSTDGASNNWGPTAVYTQSGGNASGTVHNRIAAATSQGTGSGNQTGTTAGLAPPGKQVAYSYTVSAPVTLDSIIVIMHNSISVTGTHVVNLIGDPSVSVLTGSVGGGSTLATTTVNTNNWATAGGVCSFPNNGGGATFLPYLTNAGAEFFYGSSTFTGAGFPQLQITGAKPGHHYTLELYASYTFTSSPNNSSTTDLQAYDGTTLYGPISFDSKSGSSGYNGGTSGPLTVLPNGSGVINVYFSKHAAGTSDYFTAGVLRVKQID